MTSNSNKKGGQVTIYKALFFIIKKKKDDCTKRVWLFYH
jgi:hypothetical protein